MSTEYVEELVKDIAERLKQVSAEREQLERDLHERLGPLREEEARLIRARDALERGPG